MARATELQWGRVLAAAWRNTPTPPAGEPDDFRTALQLNPRNAIDTYRLTIPGTPLVGDHFGISATTTLVDLDYISSSGDVYAGFNVFSESELLGIIYSMQPMGQDSWNFYQDPPIPGYPYPFPPVQSGHATRFGPGNPGENLETTLTLQAWSKIYGCIWYDYRRGDPSMMNTFELDPAAGVALADAELSGIHAQDINYTAGTTRLFTLVDQPVGIPNGDLDEIILDGDAPGSYYLSHIVRKCC